MGFLLEGWLEKELRPESFVYRCTQWTNSSSSEVCWYIKIASLKSNTSNNESNGQLNQGIFFSMTTLNSRKTRLRKEELVIFKKTKSMQLLNVMSNH